MNTLLWREAWHMKWVYINFIIYVLFPLLLIRHFNVLLNYTDSSKFIISTVKEFLPVDTKTWLLKLLVEMAPQDGFEPPAKRLTVACSTAELPGTITDHWQLYILTYKVQYPFLIGCDSTPSGRFSCSTQDFVNCFSHLFFWEVFLWYIKQFFTVMSADRLIIGWIIMRCE